MHMDSSSVVINLIHVLQMLETVDTATRNLSAKSFSYSPSLSLMDTNVKLLLCHKENSLNRIGYLVTNNTFKKRQSIK